MAVPTTEEIYNDNQQIIADQTALADLVPQADTAQDLLSDVTTPSRIAEHRLWNWVFSYLSRLVRVNFEEHKEEVNLIAEESPYGHLRWWVKILKLFQFGNSLVFVGDKIGYATVDTSLQIVKYAAAVQALDAEVFLKVNKDVSGEPAELSTPEFNALAEYIKQIQPAGVKIQLISSDPDFFRLFGTVYFNPLVIAPDGSLLSDPSVFPVEDAVKGYLKAIPYNGVLNVTRLIDAIQLAEGVNDFVPSLTQWQLGIGGWNAFTVQYETVAGAIRLSTTPGDLLSDTLTYTAG